MLAERSHRLRAQSGPVDVEDGVAARAACAVLVHAHSVGAAAKLSGVTVAWHQALAQDVGDWGSAGDCVGVVAEAFTRVLET